MAKKIEIHLQKNIKNGSDLSKFTVNDCIEWAGTLDRHGYEVKKVTWLDNSCFLERIHHVAYMCHLRLLRNEVPRLNEQGIELDVSHICHIY